MLNFVLVELFDVASPCALVTRPDYVQQYGKGGTRDSQCLGMNRWAENTSTHRRTLTVLLYAHVRSEIAVCVRTAAVAVVRRRRVCRSFRLFPKKRSNRSTASVSLVQPNLSYY